RWAAPPADWVRVVATPGSSVATSVAERPFSGISRTFCDPALAGGPAELATGEGITTFATALEFAATVTCNIFPGKPDADTRSSYSHGRMFRRTYRPPLSPKTV